MASDDEIEKTQEERKKMEKQLESLTELTFDTDLYGDSDKASYFPSIPATEEEETHDAEVIPRRNFQSYTGHDVAVPINNSNDAGDNEVVTSRRIIDREDDYRRRRLNQILSPDRHDAFAAGEKTPDPSVRSYADIMRDEALKREREETIRLISKKKKEEEEAGKAAPVAEKEKSQQNQQQKRRNRWDQNQNLEEGGVKKSKTSDWDAPDSNAMTPGRWDATPTPGRVVDATPGRRNRWDETPTPGRLVDSDATPGGVTPGGVTPGGATWDATPKLSGGITPTPKRQRSRWDETPATMGSVTPLPGATPAAAYTPGVTPVGGVELATPTPGALQGSFTPEQYNLLRWERDIEERNRPLTDEELDAMFPQEGYKVLDPPASYVPIRTPARKLLATPTPLGTPLYQIPEENRGQQFDVPKEAPGGLPFMKPEDYQYFGALLNEENEEELSPDEQKERKIMKLLLKVKNGTPPQRKTALRQLTDKAREFGAGPLFNRILPLLMQPTLEDQERHLLVKVIDRVLYKLDELVRPYVHKILVVIEPLLIDEDYYARVEGREIISNLSKAAGLATMIAAMRPDIDNIDEYVRNTTARAFSVVASALGIPALLPFLKAVCQSKKSWQARHTGIKIVQQIAILIGCAVLPHLRSLVEIIEHGLNDENQKVRTITALSLAALAEAAAPYGIESFDSVLKPLWKGIRQHRGKVLAAFLKAIGFIIPLMEALYASYYTKEVMLILIREFQSPDEEMKKIVLKVVKQCVSTEGVEAEYIRTDILPEFFRNFWVRRMALDRRNYKQLVETTVEIANKVGVADIVGRIVEDLKDESEPYRRMVMETIEKVVTNLGSSDIDARLEELLIDGILYAFQEQTSDDANVMLNGFGAVVNSLGQRVKPYLPQICGTIKWRLNNKSAKVRQQAADLISRIAVVMKQCHEEQLMGHLGVVLYEYLGEEYPEVLGSILGALKSIVNVIGMTKMTPPIKDLLPRLTPILKNRHEKVQENCIDLVGRIADRGAEFVPAREWMRICFELLEMLKAHKKGIRRATVNTFGYIAKAIGPQDVLATLLNNLKVQERQNRVCTTVAIAIVAETCSPFTVLPALMNEYRVPELNVQNGVLKSLSFLFEYIGEMGKDYIYAVTPLLEDALMDRDLVHRQTAASAVKHMALGVAGLGCEDALVHLLNYVWPNIFETSPHVINAVMEAIEGMRVALGSAVVLNYCLQGLFHPARKVREVYWKIYNSLYIGAQDALVAAYPSLEDEHNNVYSRSELMIWRSMKRVQSFPSHMLPVGRFHKFGRFKHHNCWSSEISVQNFPSNTCPLSNLVIIISLDSEFIGFPCIPLFSKFTFGLQCGLGDEFRCCSTHPYKGPAFKMEKKVELSGNFLAADIR
ncbi:splicing factor 3B subunit 1 [Medicago truncatula]|uniref:Splicing factor 3B subunit 1 n=2 Tax=Trifolieae TaxID=163742 RepID=G7IPK2_MEDTR|nr:splicing factor 3B subunit 1 [Medicago truncatula]